jgi:hypothetical protein
MTDYVNHPPHYTVGRVETIDVIEGTIQHAPDAVIGRLPPGASAQVRRSHVAQDRPQNAEQDGQKACWTSDAAVRSPSAKTRKSQDETLVIGGGGD